MLLLLHPLLITTWKVTIQPKFTSPLFSSPFHLPDSPTVSLSLSSSCYNNKTRHLIISSWMIRVSKMCFVIVLLPFFFFKCHLPKTQMPFSSRCMWNCFLFILAIHCAIAAIECLPKGADPSILGGLNRCIAIRLLQVFMSATQKFTFVTQWTGEKRSSRRVSFILWVLSLKVRLQR